MKTRHYKHHSLLAASLIILSGCAVGPDYKKAESAAPLAYSQPTPEAAIDVAHWVELYNEPQLAALVELARLYNYNLDALYQRTLQSRTIINRERSGRRPQVNTNAAANSFEDSEELGNSGESEDSYSAGLTLGWELDLFGRVARLVEAAEADAEASQAAYDELLLLTETDVAINYFRLRALKREIEAVERSVETRRESLDIIEQRFESGTVSDLDVAQSETLLAESEADLAALLRTSEALEHALAVLTGQYATDFEVDVGRLAGSPVVAPVGLPSSLLTRRPDLRQAEFALQAANARVGVATANFYPRITIGGSAGFAALDAGNWFKNTAGFYSIGPEVSLPIFQGGRLRSELSRTELAYAEALSLYQQAVVEAFAEVEDALSGWRHLSTQRAARERAASSAQRAQSIADKQYRSGLIDFISALDAERTALDAERRLAQVIGDEYENSVRLIRSAGGNWQ
ncbi:MAG: efflux transporter outer membrane subunit [Verrucomicrobiota bacterium]